MALADRLAEGPGPNPRAGCGFGKVLSQADDDTADALRDALADPSWPDTALARVLRDEGHTSVSDNMVQRHRRGMCGCNERPGWT